MTIEEHIELFKRIDGLTRRKNTGTPKQLAEKLNLSERQVLRIMKILKNYLPIEFSKSRQSYYYYFNGRASILEFIKEEEELELRKNGKAQATK